MEIIKRIRQVLRRLFEKYFYLLIAEREKAELRHKVLTLPITHEYPFDPEQKLLRSIGIESPMLDIGANTGIYSATFEDIVGSENLFIFEPLPHLQRHLRQKFKKSHVFDFAISDKEGTQRIRVPYIKGKRCDTRATFNSHSELNQTGFDEIEVNFFSLDSVVKELQLESIGFIKIDVEGHELQVIDGGIETFTRFKPLILIEIESRHHPFPISNIFSKFEDIGYAGYYIDPQTYKLLKVAQFDNDRDQDLENLTSRNFICYLNNFFFVHETSENDFVTKAVAFLDSEKRCVEHVASADTRIAHR
ncbi:MAG: FkbM family methyltransferase [Deltaproteobacteria bacterium]|nr:FkbM family methyltransferase [Deltaproteobacteria bacterium]TLN05241.1 MAG: FkbM family methyltransferase [bacterium]